MRQFTFYANRPAENYHKIDIWLLISVLLLWGLGFFTLFVCSQSHAELFLNDPFSIVKRQLIASAIGFFILIVFLIIDIRVVKNIIPFFVIATLILCFATQWGDEIKGAKRWIQLPLGITFQPSELAKFAVMLYLSNYFDNKARLENPESKTLFPCVVIFVLFVLSVLFQKDFSTAIFLAIVGILLFFVSGSKCAWLIPFGILAIPTCFILVAMEPYRLQRLIGWIRPTEYSSTINYQSLAAKRAISAGGLFGNGIGVGLTKINNIPEIRADYIFAGWAEAMGYFGIIVYVALLVFFAYRGYRTALLCKNRFAAYGSFGCVTVIFLQSLVNIAVVCGLLPSTGIPLPFFSMGGSSIIVTLAMCGFVLSASRCEDEEDDNSAEVEDINMEPFSYL